MLCLRSTNRLAFTLARVLTLATIGAACGAPMVIVPEDHASPADAAVDRATPLPDVVDVVTPPTDVPATAQVEAIEIEPADSVIPTQLGATTEQMFRAVGRRTDGTHTGPLPASWSINVPEVGTIDAPTGRFTTSGNAGGELRVTAVAGVDGRELRAETRLRVQMEATRFATGTASSVAMLFGAAGTVSPTSSPVIAYPLDGAVMPQNLFPADIQWENGVAGDVFRVRLRKSNLDVSWYGTHSGTAFHNDYVVDRDLWRLLAQTDTNELIEITVDRWIQASGTVVRSNPVHMRFARATLAGSIYYHEIRSGSEAVFMRINDGTYVREEPIAAARGRCMGCHDVSHDGRYLAVDGGPGSTNVGLVFDLTAAGALAFPEAGAPQLQFSSVSPRNNRVIADRPSGANVGGRLFTYDVATGREVAPTSGTLPSTNAAHPAWSPDGNSIAYVSGVTASADSFAQLLAGDISILPVTGSDTFGTTRLLHRGADLASSPEGGVVDAHPSWSPDNHWVAFSHGHQASNMDGMGLYVVEAAGGTPMRLNNALRGATPENGSFARFAPFVTPGYLWLAFVSRRPYGNRAVGNVDRRLGSTRTLQMWVTAIRTGIDATADPSTPPFWVPGQSVATSNVTPEWAPRACRRDTEVCSVDSECCGGRCVSGRCVPPPMDRCRAEGELCGGAGCCAGLECAGNACLRPPG